MTSHSQNRRTLNDRTTANATPQIMSPKDGTINFTPANKNQNHFGVSFDQGSERSKYLSPVNKSAGFKRVTIPPQVQEQIQVDYSNVLPTNLRHGNNNVMPLIPQNLDNLAKGDKEKLRRVIQDSSYTLA